MQTLREKWMQTLREVDEEIDEEIDDELRSILRTAADDSPELTSSRAPIAENEELNATDQFMSIISRRSDPYVALELALLRERLRHLSEEGRATQFASTKTFIQMLTKLDKERDMRNAFGYFLPR